MYAHDFMTLHCFFDGFFDMEISKIEKIPNNGEHE